MLDLYNPLRTYRNDRKLSVQELADAIGVARSTMVAVEDGRRGVTREQRDALAALLKVDPAKLQYLVDALQK